MKIWLYSVVFDGDIHHHFGKTREEAIASLVTKYVSLYWSEQFCDEDPVPDLPFEPDEAVDRFFARASDNGADENLYISSIDVDEAGAVRLVEPHAVTHGDALSRVMEGG